VRRYPSPLEGRVAAKPPGGVAGEVLDVMEASRAASADPTRLTLAKLGLADLPSRGR